jgi:hypothetical protein
MADNWYEVIEQYKDVSLTRIVQIKFPYKQLLAFNTDKNMGRIFFSQHHRLILWNSTFDK